MKILIDIGHPAHVHYFKNFIKIMKDKGHKFLIISRNKEIEHYLLKSYDISFIDRGKGQNYLFRKILYYFKAIYIIYKESKKFNPDIMLSFGSPYVSFVAKLTNNHHIIFNDTEHAKLSHLLSDPFSKCILTPASYTKNLGKKQIHFNGFMELCYLQPDYFTPDKSILDLLKVKKDEKYVIMRFVSWNASHDMGQTGLSIEMKHKIINELSKYAKIFISSEGELPENLKEYQINIPAERMHDVLAFATMFIGESGTMASECAVLGIPTIYINTLPLMGYLDEEQDKGLLFHFNNSKGVLKKALELLNSSNLKQKFQKLRQEMLIDKIDVTAFMVWFIENYPASAKIMKENPDYQNRFK